MSASPQDLDPLALAAVDLGSNSFHAIVAREVDGWPQVVDKLRERVALAEGLQPGRGLDTVVQARALDTLERFGERLKAIPQHRIRAVGTATFRRVRDGGAFLRLASEALGAPIEILPGREEARLVYLGVAQDLGDTDERRLVVDIGGGSTECMIGTRFVCHSGDSLTMGCVTWSKRYFPGGRMTAEAFAQAELAARVELEPIARLYHREHWEHAVGSSGTIRAVGAILEGFGLTGSEITKSGLKKLKAKLMEVEQCDHLELEGMPQDRRHVMAGGVAVLWAVFQSLGIETMTPSAGALREGVLHDHLGRIHHEDIRESSAQAFMDRMGLDTAHGGRCRSTAEGLFDQVGTSLGLQLSDRKLLGLAASMHTIGLVVSHAGYHKHGAYLAEHADLGGFSRQDRQQLAVLIRGQRRRLRPDLLAGQSRDRLHALRCLLPLLRIALRLRRDRTNRELPPIELRASGSRFHLTFPEGWLAMHPLTTADLVRETQQLDAFGIILAVK